MSNKESTKTECSQTLAADHACRQPRARSAAGSGSAGGLYFVGMIGSFVYWAQAAHQFGAVITGVLKSLVWPAYVVYKLLEQFYGRVA